MNLPDHLKMKIDSAKVFSLIDYVAEQYDKESQSRIACEEIKTELAEHIGELKSLKEQS